jgi:hypothetical protein
VKTIFIKLAVGLSSFLLACSPNLCSGQTNFVAKSPFFNAPPAYREAVFKLMLAEANEYAGRLSLPEKLPITKDSLKEVFTTDPYVANRFGALGSLRTTNYSYGFGKGKHLSYVTRLIKGTNPYDYDDNKQYAIDPSAVNTNAAYSMATQYLAKAFVDVPRLLESSTVSIHPWVILHMTTSKYTVEWQRSGKPVVRVVLAEPKAELWTLRVEDPEYILRKPLEITNLDFLLSQTNAPATTNAPIKQ